MRSPSATDLSTAAGNITPPRFHWGTRVALPLGLLAAFGAIFANALARSLAPPASVEIIPVVEQPAIRSAGEGDRPAGGEVLAQAAGWLEPDPFPVHASTLTDGIVEEVLVVEGAAVSKGEVLARLVDDDARLSLRRAEAEAAAAEEAWESNIEARRRAAVAEAMVREARAAAERARAELVAERALAGEARRVYTRRQELLADGSISQEEFDETKALVDTREAAVRVAEQRLEEMAAKVDRMAAEAEAAQRQLDLRTEERRRLELARVALEEARLRVDRLEIRAPIDGRIMSRLVEPGSMVMAMSDNGAMSRVATLYDPRRMQVRVDVPLAEAAKVEPGQPAEVTVEVLPNRTFKGRVTRVTDLADIQKNTLEVKVAIEDPAPELKPDMLARVRFLAPSGPGRAEPPSAGLSVFAPASAITDGTAWVLTDFDGRDGIAEARSVTPTGGRRNGWVEIAVGLRPGDLLVASPPPNLRPGQILRAHRQGGP